MDSKTIEALRNMTNGVPMPEGNLELMLWYCKVKDALPELLNRAEQFHNMVGRCAICDDLLNSSEELLDAKDAEITELKRLFEEMLEEYKSCDADLDAKDAEIARLRAVISDHCVTCGGNGIDCTWCSLLNVRKRAKEERV